MTLTRWLFAGIFAMAVAGAWQAAQPKQAPPMAAQFGTSSDPFQNAATTNDIAKERLIITTPEPRKISQDYLQQ